MADVDVTVQTHIARPRAEVAAYAGDPRNAPEWYSRISVVRVLTPEPLAVGSRMDFVATFLGRELAYTYEVVELVPGESLVMRTSDGPFPMETTYRWEDEGEGTRMFLRNRGRPQGFARVTGPAMKAAIRRATTQDLAALKRHLESEGPESQG